MVIITDLLTNNTLNHPSFVLSDIADFRNGKGHESCIVDEADYIVVNSKLISTNGETFKLQISS
jgi:hypothetical protein